MPLSQSPEFAQLLRSNPPEADIFCIPDYIPVHGYHSCPNSLSPTAIHAAYAIVCNRVAAYASVEALAEFLLHRGHGQVLALCHRLLAQHPHACTSVESMIVAAGDQLPYVYRRP